MPHPELAEAEGAQRVFSLFHNLQRFRRHGTAIFNSRGETRRGWLGPHPQTRLPGEFADLGLSELRFEQRRQNVMLARRLLPRTEVALVVGVDAVCDGVETVGGTVLLHDCEQLVLAVETAHGVVASAAGIFQL